MGRAAREPDTNWVAVEKRGTRVLLILRQLIAAGLSNVRVVSGDVQGFAKLFLQDHTLSQVFINFPDPWPKKQHAKRRLLRVDGFTHDEHEQPIAPVPPSHMSHLLAKKLCAGGKCHLLTDSAAMNQEMKIAFQNCLEIPSGKPLFVSGLPQPHHAECAPEGYGSTAYRTVWQSQGRPEYYMCWSTHPNQAPNN